MAGDIRGRSDRLLAAIGGHRGRGDLSVCFVCGAHRANCQLRTRPFANEPFFPFLEHHEAAPGSFFHADGVVDACRVCHAFLIQQWMAFDKNNTPIAKRLYWLKRPDSVGQIRKLDAPILPGHPVREEIYSRMNFRNIPGLSTNNMTNDDSGRNNGITEPLSTVSTSGINGESSKKRQIFNSWDIEIPAVTLCYGCGVSVPQHAVRVVHTSHWSKSESPYFPCILGHPAPSEAKPVDQFGRVLMCELCSGYLLRQWHAQELENVPLHERVYHLRPTGSGSRSGSIISSAIGETTTHDVEEPTSVMREGSSTTRSCNSCYLCGAGMLVSDALVIRSRRVNAIDPFYPFLEKHIGSPGSQHLSSEGTALVCGACHTDLDEQWNAHDLMETPFDKRVYRIPHKIKNESKAKPSTTTSHKAEEVKDRGEEKVHVRKHKYEVCYLCAEITSPTGTKQISTQQITETESSDEEKSSGDMYFPFVLKVKRPHKARKMDKDGKVLVCIPCFNHLEKQWTAYDKDDIDQDDRCYILKETDDSSEPTTYSNKPLTDTAKQDTVCFLCGVMCRPRDHYRLHSFPRRNQQEHPESIPFFPFLTKHSPAPNASPINSDGIATACRYCYINLNTQWHDYEKSSEFLDNNRWLRRYNVSGFVCFVCSQVVQRVDIRKVSVKEYPCLLRHERPNGAIILEDRNAVITCPTCDMSLYTQKKAFDHLEVPDDKRAYQLTHSVASACREKQVLDLSQS